MKTNQEDLALLQSALQKEKLTKQEYIRVKAVELTKRGKTRSVVMECLDVGSASLQRWVHAFKQRRINGLKNKKRTTSGRAQLAPWQKAELKRVVYVHKPNALGYDEDYWDVATLAKHVKKTYGVVYTGERTYQRLLSYCRLTRQRVEFIDHRKHTEKEKDFKVQFKKKLKKETITMSW